MDSLASGYMIRPWLMTPVQRPTTRPQRRYNCAHSSTRSTVQRSIGVAKQRWHYLHCGLRPQPQKEYKVILVCFMLHNCARHLKLPPPPHDSDNNWEEDDTGDEENDENPSLLVCILMSFYRSITSHASICSVCGRACVCDEMSVSFCFCKRSGLLRDGAPLNSLLQ